MQLSRPPLALALALLACTPDGGARFEYPITSADPGLTTTTSDDPGPPPPGLPDDPPDDPTGGPATAGPLISPHATWRHLPLQAAVDPTWKDLEFDDSTWPEGQAPFGDAAGDATPIDPVAAPLGLRLRHTFTTTAPADDIILRAFLRRGDGVALYLNGAPLLRSNLPPEPLAADATAAVDLVGNEALRYIRLAAPHINLRSGPNVIAVEVRRHQPGASGLGFDLQLDLWDLASEPSDALSAQVRTRSYGGEYADDHVGAAWIEGPDGLVRTLAVWAEVREQHLIRWRSRSGGDNGDAITGATRSTHRTTDLTWDLLKSSPQGAPVPPGTPLKLVIEFTEDNSNEGEPPGPVLEIPFTLGGGPHLVEIPADPRFADVLLVAP